MDLSELTIKSLRDKVRSGEIKARAVVEDSLKRAKDTQGKLNAFITICEKEALLRADQIDKTVSSKKDPGALAGVCVAVKDLLLTKGVKTTAASKILADFIPPYSSTVVEKLEAAGAIIIGKTNLDEFAMGASNENSAFGPVKNPWDLTRVPGGSSGGSAAAVAARIAPASIGTDTGGSIREPASFCGVVGIKPTYGRVSRYGVVAFASSLDQVGPMAQNVEDAALMLEVISGKDKHDSTSADVLVPAFSEKIIDNMKGLKVGLPKEYFVDGIEPEVRKAVDQAVSVLKAQGAEVVEVSLPLTEYGIAVYYLIAPCEASSNLARYDGVRFGHRTSEAKDIHELYRRSRGEGFGAEPKRRIMLGTYALSSGYYDAYYKKACQVRRLIRDDFLKAFSKCDVIATPVATGPAFKLGEKATDPLAMYLNDVFTLSPSLAGIPGLSVNCGFTKEGLPIGLQLLSKHFDEEKIIRAAYTVEKHSGLPVRRPHGF
ncbi:MAG: Asp-tRNA(Asn)/Glu-tRNA(Gln) amidotransferase subunit GatA [Oligoflexia bacterium]|nr:Asp-tRNA(Asn)/Glu-tRNA(Gln) amidotransferase subunit GatA [Oligoflexia bacterium]